MSRGRSARVTPSPCFPRVSGDEPGEFKFRDEFELFSPRERG